MKTKIYTKVQGLTKWLIILCTTISLAMSDLNIYIKYVYILCYTLMMFYLFEAEKQNNKLWLKLEGFILFPREIVRVGKRYNYQGCVKTTELSKRILDITEADLTLVEEIQGEQYQAFYKEIKETNQ